jgi:hypothetical protein
MGTSGRMNVKDQQEVKIRAVAKGLLEYLGLLPTHTQDEGLAIFELQSSPAKSRYDSWIHTGYELGAKLRQLAEMGSVGPDGRVLVDPENFGYYVIGRERTFIEGAKAAFEEGVEGLTGVDMSGGPQISEPSGLETLIEAIRDAQLNPF